MSIEEFYAQSLEIRDPWRVSEVHFSPEDKEVQVHVQCLDESVWIDPETKDRAAIHGWRERRWRHLDTCEFQTWIIAKVPRVKLSDGKVVTVKVPWAAPHGRFTVAMESQIIETLLACRTITSAAKLLGLTRDQVDAVMKRAVQRGLSRREATPLELVGLDEKALRKRHRYATILTDLISGHVIDIGNGRTKEAAVELMNSLPSEQTQSIEAVAMDMWQGYISAVEETLPEAAIVFDRYHLKAHLNQAVDKVRRGEHRRLSAQGRDILKGSKYEFLKHHEDLRTKASSRLRKLLKENLETGVAWSIKELFDHFWSYRRRAPAMRFLYDWIDLAAESAMAPLEKVASMIQTHFAGIMNYINFPITNASAEGINSRIQTLKSAARGLPSFELFRTRILFFLGGLSLHPA